MSGDVVDRRAAPVARGASDLDGSVRVDAYVSELDGASAVYMLESLQEYGQNKSTLPTSEAVLSPGHPTNLHASMVATSSTMADSPSQQLGPRSNGTKIKGVAFKCDPLHTVNAGAERSDADSAGKSSGAAEDASKERSDTGSAGDFWAAHLNPKKMPTLQVVYPDEIEPFEEQQAFALKPAVTVLALFSGSKAMLLKALLILTLAQQVAIILDLSEFQFSVEPVAVQPAWGVSYIVLGVLLTCSGLSTWAIRDNFIWLCETLEGSSDQILDFGYFSWARGTDIMLDTVAASISSFFGFLRALESIIALQKHAHLRAHGRTYASRAWAHTLSHWLAGVHMCARAFAHRSSHAHTSEDARTHAGTREHAGTRAHSYSQQPNKGALQQVVSATSQGVDRHRGRNGNA
eukprot:2702403-Pleurochrysis_carterae.AAC.1